MLTGTDENGLRIRFFTATVTGQRALKAGLGKFTYTGETADADAEADGHVTAAEKVTCTAGEGSALESGRLRHGHGEIVYHSGSTYAGGWY